MNYICTCIIYEYIEYISLMGEYGPCKTNSNPVPTTFCFSKDKQFLGSDNKVLIHVPGEPSLEPFGCHLYFHLPFLTQSETPEYVVDFPPFSLSQGTRWPITMAGPSPPSTRTLTLLSPIVPYPTRGLSGTRTVTVSI